MDADAVGVPERRLSRITPLLALLGGLTLATSASADGAWVLWLGTGTTYTPF